MAPCPLEGAVAGRFAMVNWLQALMIVCRNSDTEVCLGESSMLIPWLPIEDEDSLSSCSSLALGIDQ